jgi:hypothetical protein
MGKGNLQWPKSAFASGDETDRALWIGLQHEFLRCGDAFQDFAALGEQMVRNGSNLTVTLTWERER